MPDREIKNTDFKLLFKNIYHFSQNTGSGGTIGILITKLNTTARVQYFFKQLYMHVLLVYSVQCTVTLEQCTVPLYTVQFIVHV